MQEEVARDFGFLDSEERPETAQDGFGEEEEEEEEVEEKEEMKEEEAARRGAAGSSALTARKLVTSANALAAELDFEGSLGLYHQALDGFVALASAHADKVPPLL